MSAWSHYNMVGWDFDAYVRYRSYVSSSAPFYEGRSEDCADLSMLLLIKFAAIEGLAVTFRDNDGNRYVSKAGGVTFIGTSTKAKLVGGAVAVLSGPMAGLAAITNTLRWSKESEFYDAVKQRIGAKALFKRNTTTVPVPAPGDLLLTEEHCAIVYRTYPPGMPHPKWNDRSVPDFPGHEEAKKQTHVTRYFKGTVHPHADVTMHRKADKDFHFDYLNSRSDAKRNAELIYFANARQTKAGGFSFRKFAPHVLDNWFDWNGKGGLPR